MAGELLFFCITSFVGATLARGLSLGVVGRLGAAALSGVAVFVVVGVVLAIAGAPTSLGLIGGASVLVSVALLFVGGVRADSTRGLVADWGALVAVSGTVVLLTRWCEPGRSTLDSYDYVAISALAANGHADLVEFELLRTRLLGYPVANVAAFTDGRFALSGLSVVATLAMLAVLSAMIARSIIGEVGVWTSRLVGAAATLMLLTSYHFLFHAFYVNAHMLVGGFVLLALAPALLHDPVESGARGLARVSAACLVALPLLRPEGGLIALLIVVARVGSRTGLPSTRVAAGGVAATTIVWNLHLLRVGIASEASAGQLLQPAMTIAAAGVVLVVVEAVARGVVEARRVRSFVLAGLSALVAAFAVVEWATVRDSVGALVQNTFLGDGTWGPMLPVLIVAFIVLSIAARPRPPASVVFFVAAFFLLMIALAPLREAAYRVGPGDSLNRSMLHVVPVMAVWIVVTMIGATVPGRNDRGALRPGETEWESNVS